MKRFRLLASATVAFGCSVVALVACSGDDAVNLAVDGGADSASDTSLPNTDANTPVDSSVPDTGSPDSGDDDSGVLPDASIPFSDPDAGADADAGPSTTIRDQFTGEIADHICNRYTRCCFGNAAFPDGGAVDGGAHFDRGKCLSIYASHGYEDSDVELLQGDLTVLSLNTAQRDACFAALDALPCAPTGAEVASARIKCFGAIHGNVPSGGPCGHSIECVDGQWCDNNGDAGAPDAGSGQSTTKTGICVPLRTNGGPCGDVVITSSIGDDSVLAEEACSSRGRGETGIACISFDTTTGNYLTDRSQWKCESQVANGQICNTDVTCSTGLCDSANGYICAVAVDEFGACNEFNDP